MKEAKIIVKEYEKIDFASTKAALVTVVQVRGSSYRREGARMLVLDNGLYFGGVSGGCLERDVLRKTVKAILKDSPSLITYDTTQDDEHQVGVGLGCNGIIDVLVTPLHTDDEENPVRLLSKAIKSKKAGVIVSIINADRNNNALGKCVYYENDDQFIHSFSISEIALFVLQAIKDCTGKQKSQTLSYNYSNGVATIFIEVILPALQLVIYGNNYDIHPLARIAKELEWDVAIVTKSEKTSLQFFNTAIKVYNHPEMPRIDNRTAVILMAHDYKTDLENFKNVLNTSAFYIGLLGPGKRSQRIFDDIAERNILINKEKQDRIFAPAGLDIGANDPEEIALSILAEIKNCNSGKSGSPLKWKTTPIHAD